MFMQMPASEKTSGVLPTSEFPLRMPGTFLPPEKPGIVEKGAYEVGSQCATSNQVRVHIRKSSPNP
jgi:hypothetical protein